MKKKIAGIILLVTSILYSSASGVFARTDSEVEVQNYIETGDIDISLKQYNSEGEDFKDGQIWTPGDRIADVIRIENQARECWIRVAAKYAEVISLKGISDGWIFREPYWYYTEILLPEEKIIFSDELLFSAEVTEKLSGKTDSVEITAEAVQAANFVPDFKAEAPWGDQAAELCVHMKDGTEVEKTRNYQELRLQMEGEAGRLVAVPDDFFSNLSELMPGDIQSDEIVVYNAFNKEAELFFRTEDAIDMTEQQRELLEQMRLMIYNDDKLIYQGDLRSLKLNKEISLGVWKSGEKGTLKYTISMPADLKNEFAVRDAGICWIFRTDIEEEPPKTGDNNWRNAYLIFALVSGTLGIWMLFSKKKSKH